MVDWSQCSAVERSADTLGGAWRFRGTRVPIRALLENRGISIDEFLELFPGVSREQVAEAMAFLLRPPTPLE